LFVDSVALGLALDNTDPDYYFVLDSDTVVAQSFEVDLT
jgi:hypothetical protein